jgi:hypothetical protein
MVGPGFSPTPAAFRALRRGDELLKQTPVVGGLPFVRVEPVALHDSPLDSDNSSEFNFQCV